MSEKTKSLTKQVCELTARLDKLEAMLGGAQKRYSDTEAGEEVQQFCRLPDVPERTFGSDVSPHRARLIRYLDKKWVNGTKLRYYFFESGSFSGGDEQKDLVREGFGVWEEFGIGVSFEEVADIGEAEEELELPVIFRGKRYVLSEAGDKRRISRTTERSQGAGAQHRAQRVSSRAASKHQSM